MSDPPPFVPESTMDQPPPRPTAGLIVSRALLLGWCVWLLVSWVVNLKLDTPSRAWIMETDGSMTWRVPADAFTQVVRGMFISMMVGIGLAWPAWRLSQPAHPRIGRETAVDLATLLLVCQVVIWPVRTLIEISLSRLMLVGLVLAAWGGAAAVLVWLGRKSAGPLGGAAAMLGCAALLFGGWLAAFAIGDMGPAHASPLSMLWALCGTDAVDEPAMLRSLGLVAGLAAAVWAVELGTSPRAKLSSQ